MLVASLWLLPTQVSASSLRTLPPKSAHRGLGSWVGICTILLRSECGPFTMQWTKHNWYLFIPKVTTLTFSLCKLSWSASSVVHVSCLYQEMTFGDFEVAPVAGKNDARGFCRFPCRGQNVVQGFCSLTHCRVFACCPVWSWFLGNWEPGLFF